MEATMSTIKTPQPKNYHVTILRPSTLRERLSDVLWNQVGPPIEMVMNMTRSDIDNGASGYVMVDKNFNPTGAPPPDPDGAYCAVCRQRIWAHDDNTAFPTRLGFNLDDDGVEVAGGACCEKCSQMSDEELLAEIYGK
jgi:hypothetical protein